MEPTNDDSNLIHPDQTMHTRRVETAEAILDPAGSLAFLTGSAHDIQAQRQTQQLYQAIFENSLAVKLLLDPASGAIIDANSAAARFYGYPVAQLKTMKIDQINTLPPAKIAQEMDAALHEQRSYFNFQHRLADGSLREVEVYSSPLEIGGRTLLNSIIHDITATQRAHKALRESEEKYRILLEESSDPIFSFNPAIQYTYANQALADSFGKKREEFIGKTISDIFPPEEAQRRTATIQRVFTSGKTLTYEGPVLQPDGSHTFLTTATPILNERQEVISVICVSKDITAQKKTEEALRLSQARLELAQRSAGAGTWDWDMPSGQLTWSPELFRLFGLNPLTSQANFSTWNQALHPDDLEIASRRIQQAIQNKTQLQSEYRIRHPDGQVRWIYALGNTTYADDGQPVRMAGICIDISARKQAEAQITEQLEELRRWHSVTLGREERILALKREVNQLLAEAGKPPHYASVAQDPPP